MTKMHLQKMLNLIIMGKKINNNDIFHPADLKRLITLFIGKTGKLYSLIYCRYESKLI